MMRLAVLELAALVALSSTASVQKRLLSVAQFFSTFLSGVVAK